MCIRDRYPKHTPQVHVETRLGNEHGRCRSCGGVPTSSVTAETVWLPDLKGQERRPTMSGV
eukprot:11038521-Prorocentrum_lima.AAC.1